MPYFFHCIDDPAKQSVRSEFMNEHLAYIETILDELAIAGPLKQAAEADPDSSCFIYNTDSREKALELLHNDPYYRAGLWETVSCRQFVAAAGSWIGGKIW
jgi:hypothetical protein